MYRARRPFHPARLYELVHDKFVILEPQNEEGEDEDENEHDGEEEDDDDEAAEEDTASVVESEASGSDSAPDPSDDATTCISSESSSDSHAATSPATSVADSNTITQYPDIPLEKRLANKKSHPLFSRLLRSKGFVWLATRPKQSGDWSQAGAMLTFSPGMQWFTTLAVEEWPIPEGPAGVELKKLIEKDFDGEWGDRRQEVVLIGEGLDIAGLTECLDGCLLKGDEISEWEDVMRMDVDDEKREELLCELFEDGWEEWEDPEVLMAGDEDGHVHGPACAM